ncbi:hypothetical protein [Roseovarius faecimaris]|uniref:hypothetical protein n=1 Tax=Roseovarius faecimaris TaxID=2494550 RepID=UPI0012FD129B|nr:hypothetical protein [Roseovarius faecimaris]
MTRTLLIATVLTLSTTLSAQATCNGKSHSQQAMSCAEGAVWDSATQTCVPQISS